MSSQNMLIAALMASVASAAYMPEAKAASSPSLTTTTSIPASTTFNGFCNAAAVARGDCTAPAASVPSSTASTTFNGFCNAAAVARGDCTAPAASVPSSTASTTFNGFCNAAAVARGDCTAPAASVPSAPQPVTTTQIFTAYTTYCPSPTQFAVNNVTYTVSSATTLTIKDCPCTVVSTGLVTTPAGPTGAVPTSAPTGPASVATSPVVYASVPATAPSRNATATTTKPAVQSFTGAADKVGPVAGAVALGLLAFL
ncbi:hypothetical protein KVT40_000332 [Elsinoe batatas]|uniref:Uncharacterized protein n=1 Tax=Elsinoe batatas TaxID=2601811 RepID=A0A8K0L8L4_9PEZI|nr:hypothetical protein KVT40_000332 [Elsinoe batatas]